MKISVITCTYDSERHLRQCVASVLCQNYRDIEYIFVDGGSTDKTLEIIRSTPINYKLVEGINTGISAAMNAGLRAATGDVIAHLHSDDYYLNEHVLSLVAETLRESGRDWLFGRIMLDRDGKLEPEPYLAPAYSYKRLLKGNFIPHPATFVKKALFEKAGYFSENIKYAMDYDMWLRLGKLSEPLQLSESLTAFRLHDGSLTSANQLAALQDDFNVRMRHVGWAPVDLIYHVAHYVVRKARIKRRLLSE